MEVSLSEEVVQRFHVPRLAFLFLFVDLWDAVPHALCPGSEVICVASAATISEGLALVRIWVEMEAAD